jgi:hypothetical protein
MILRGTFDFSHVNMVVVNKSTVFCKHIVGKKKPVEIWRQEHHPKIYQTDDIKKMIQGYLDSPFHRVCPSESTINIYHKTKKEMENCKVRADPVVERNIPNVCMPVRYAAGDALIRMCKFDPPIKLKQGDIVNIRL